MFLMATSLYSSQRAVLARPLDATDTTHAAVPLIQKLFIGFALLVMSGAVIPLLRESSKASYDPNVGDQSSAWMYVGVYLLVVPLTLTRLAQMIGVIGSVGNDNLGLEVGDQRAGLRNITGLTGRQSEPDWATQAAHGEMEFGAQAAARTADGLILSPPFAPAACW